MRRGYTMEEKARPRAAFLAFDVGKAAHRACAVGVPVGARSKCERKG